MIPNKIHCMLCHQTWELDDKDFQKSSFRCPDCNTVVYHTTIKPSIYFPDIITFFAYAMLILSIIGSVYFYFHFSNLQSQYHDLIIFACITLIIIGMIIFFVMESISRIVYYNYLKSIQ